MEFSLILATCNRLDEIDKLFESLINQDIGAEKFEIIIVDQNTELDISSVIEKYQASLKILHIKSNTKGLSFNRNIGLRHASGRYICFPDDDCEYYSDTLSKAYSHLQQTEAFAVAGAIRDRSTGNNIIRNWPRIDTLITSDNFFHLSSSITIFTSRNSINFNENLGAGCYFGSCEDCDYVYRIIKGFGSIPYFSDLEVWHPPGDIKKTTVGKNISYALGHGAFFAIHRKDLRIIKLFSMALVYHTAMAILSILKFDRLSIKKRADSVKYRIIGFSQYKKQLSAKYLQTEENSQPKDERISTHHD
ncbi:glycosyltransferase family 2 protein [Pseudomonas sp. PI1]|jgi:glycosyltransferase involved in cell wall biosynthesis|uniref:glycosyltransferase family 2 protein n=1 Tax=Pseudomonas sp. PI1 TaxID=1582493 RepID=UPI0013792136|nr:glycosyltransferase family 2 protein [Pseudomonas sp. PI1]